MACYRLDPQALAFLEAIAERKHWTRTTTIEQLIFRAASDKKFCNGN